MDSIIYKVIFKGSKNIEKEKLSLTFKEISLDTPLTIPNEFTKKFKKLNRQNIINFKNIDAVLRFGKDNSPLNYNYYYILLFSHKGKKQGFLIGNLINLGDNLIGIWPFNTDFDQLSIDNLIDIYEDLITNPKNYEQICVIS